MGQRFVCTLRLRGNGDISRAPGGSPAKAGEEKVGFVATGKGGGNGGCGRCGGETGCWHF